MADPVQLELVGGESDVAKAERYKQQLMELLVPICDLYTKAKKDKIALSFGVGYNAFGIASVIQFGAVKELL
jgi:hypothetical protein